MFKLTPEKRALYNENRRKKIAAMTPEEREEFLRKRRIYEKEKRIAGGEERRLHDREIRIAYVHRKTLENPNWSSDRYKKSKCVKAQRAAELAKTLKEDEAICSRCKFVHKLSDFPITRAGTRSTMCSKCYSYVTKDFDTESLSFWKAQAAKVNASAKKRLLKANADLAIRYKPVTGEDLMALWDRQKHKCNYCGCVLNVLIMAYDHKDPLARGGSHSIDNLQFICHNCNVSKFLMSDEEYRKLIQ